MTRIESEVISPMVDLCKLLSVDHRAAMPSVFDAGRLLRSIAAGRDGVTPDPESYGGL